MMEPTRPDRGPALAPPPLPGRRRTPSAIAAVDGERFGRYRLVADLAVGGMARIYLAHFDGPGGFVKPCVIKKIHQEMVRSPDFKQMFTTEARVAALLNHPNIVQAFDFGEVDGEFFLALEWVDGASLASVIRAASRRRRVASIAATVHVGIQVCEALAYAHAARGPDGASLGLVHRDVTPANVLVTRTGAVKLTDFGVVKSSMHESQPGVLKGKLAYLSPEQARCKKLDGRSDLFSLALVLYELVTGICPFARRSMGDSIKAVMSVDVTRPSAFMPFPERLERILFRALEPDPAKRYPSAQAMKADFEALQAQQGWTRGASELAATLAELFPEGLALTNTLTATPPIALAADVAEVEAVDDTEPVPQARPASDATATGPLALLARRRWLDLAAAAALGFAASSVLWLLALR